MNHLVTPEQARQCQRILDGGGTFKDVLVFFSLTIKSRYQGTRCAGCGHTACKEHCKS